MSVISQHQNFVPKSEQTRSRSPLATPQVNGSRRSRTFVAVVLLTLSALIIAVQVRASRLSTVPRDVFLQRVNLRPGSQATGILTIRRPLTWGTYAVDVIFPDNAAPGDFGMAYPEVRRNVRITIKQSHGQIVIAPSQKTTSQFADRLDSRKGVHLCDFEATSAEDVTIACRLSDGPPWPDSVSVAISHGQSTSDVAASQRMTASVQPFSFGFSALLACISVGLCWRTP
jgi:hypothetical protein